MTERQKVNMSLLDLLPGPFPTGVMGGLTLWKIPEGDPPAQRETVRTLLLPLDPDKLHQQGPTLTLAMDSASGSSQLSQL